MPPAGGGSNPKLRRFNGRVGLDLENHADFPWPTTGDAGGEARPCTIAQIDFAHCDITGLEGQGIGEVFVPGSRGTIHLIKLAGPILDFEAHHFVAPTAILMQQSLLGIAGIYEGDFERSTEADAGSGRRGHRNRDKDGRSESESDGDH